MRNIAEVNASMATSRVTIIGISTNDIITPAMARPRGCLNSPMNDKTEAIIHISHPINGTHPMKTLTSDNTNPAVPIPFERLSPGGYGCQGCCLHRGSP